MNLNPEHLKIIKNSISSVLPGIRIYLFGSRLNGSPRRDSDCDLALDASRPLSPPEMNEIRDELDKSALSFHVDLTDIQTASPEFIVRISSTWQEI